jgi:peptidoglycan/xylan/chitin deacetylase (PgdA/CDA1 family)
MRHARRALQHGLDRFRPRAVILMYHRVAEVPCDPWDLCVTPPRFADQLDVLRRQCDVVSLADLLEVRRARRIGGRFAAVTFDDGYGDNLDAARPLLEGRSCPATFFLTSGALGGPHEFWWDQLERLLLQPGTLPGELELTVDGSVRRWKVDGDAGRAGEWWEHHRTWRAWNPPRNPRQALFGDLWALLHRATRRARDEYLDTLHRWAGGSRDPRPTHRVLTREEARRLCDGGRFEAGAHSVTHVALSFQKAEEQAEEIGSSKRSLEALTGRPVRHFAYPYGDYSAETVRMVREAGFDGAVTTDAGRVPPRKSAWQLPRLAVGDWDGREFERRLRAAFEAR